MSWKIPLTIMALSCAVLTARADDEALVKRGEYLATCVSMCADCHTQRDQHGQFKMNLWMMGGVLDVEPRKKGGPWAKVAPIIRGLPRYTGEQAVTLLTTGIGREGKPLNPPMPRFRMSKEDAEAIVAYLRSLVKR